MRDLALLLHIYQPPTQFPEIVKEIVETSYRPLLELLEHNPRAKITLNICASLTEQLEKYGYNGVLHQLVSLAEKGQIEFTGSAKYHPLLSKLSPREMRHQIKLNEETNQRILGDQIYKPKGFFPPEMAYSSHVGRVIEEMGFNWVVVSEDAFSGKDVSGEVVYQIPGGDLNVLFRDKLLSLGLAFSGIKTAREFVDTVAQEGDGYSLVALDGETFGHHVKDSLGLLENIFAREDLVWSTVSSLVDKYCNFGVREIEVLSSTWGAMQVDYPRNRIFPRWDNPDNPVHVLQWQLFYLALSIMSRSEVGEAGCLQSRLLFDKAIHSDQFFWAGANPCWHPEIVRRGAALLVESIVLSPMSFPEEKKRAQELQAKIIETGVNLYGDSVKLE